MAVQPRVLHAFYGHLPSVLCWMFKKDKIRVCLRTKERKKMIKRIYINLDGKRQK